MEIGEGTPFFREYRLLIEYKHLPRKMPPGFYVIPSFETLFEWHCVLFVRQGMYRNGIFKFKILIPREYPKLPPEVFFVSQVFHPNVHPTSGKVEYVHDLPGKHWDANKHHIFYVLSHVRRMMYQPDLDSFEHVNSEAWNMLVKDREIFRTAARACVLNSINNVFYNADYCSIQFREFSSGNVTDEEKKIYQMIQESFENPENRNESKNINKNGNGNDEMKEVNVEGHLENVTSKIKKLFT